jgi:nitrite reductase/ring-hydroxylating ferredoxin subunit
LQDYDIGKLKDLREGRGSLMRVAGEEVSVFKVEGRVFAIGNVCPHQHFSKLHEGDVNGFVVTCPMHGWSYDVRTGLSTNADGRVKSYEVVIRGEEVFILNDGNADSTD